MSLSCLLHFFSHAFFLFTFLLTFLLIVSLIAFMATQRSSSSTFQDVKKRKGDDSSCSEEEEEEEEKEEEEKNIITSSSSSSSTSRWKYDVFLSFYGKDTRWGFTDHLYNSLKQRGINVYRDDETLERGKYIGQELLQAIQESQCAIIILSENYAFSKWCLMELAKIIEWEEKKKLTIIPIFYHVDPSHVKNQIGPFSEAFAAHEKDLHVDTAQIDIWKNAFRKVGNIAGEHIQPGRYESEIIRKISEKIFYNYTLLNILFYDHKKLVGINSRVEQMMKLLDMESNDVRFLGIQGMGGVGKTTLAKVIFEKISSQFEGSSFISRIRENSTTARDLACLQGNLLSMIMRAKICVDDPYQGTRMICSMLRSKKVFIILDDVDSEEQLKALAGSQDWLGAGSRVIITCRDSHLLKRHKVKHIYTVKQLQFADSLQLFSLSAFDKTHPPEDDYIDLCKHFVRYAEGLPLALEVLGSFLFDRTIDAWKSARDQLEEASPNTKIMTVLQISFEGLQQDSQKKLFLDMACFERWQDYNIKENMYSDIDMEVLVDKSLVTKSNSGMLFMHDLLRKMGQEIVRRECPKEPGQRSRLFRQQDVFHVLKNDTGTDVIECIVLDCLHDQTKESLNAKALSKMRNLRWLIFGRCNSPTRECCEHSPYIEWHGNPLKYLRTSRLRILHLYGYHLKSWPSTFQPKNLTELRMRDSRFKRLWKGSMDLCNLKKIDLSYSKYLIEIPDLTGTPKLEKIVLVQCTSLCEVHPSVGALKQLQELIITHSCIKQVWKGLVSLCNLKEIDLSYSKYLIEIPDLTGTPKLEKIVLQWCRSLCEVHPSVGALKRLQELIICGSHIKQVWKGLVVLNNLKELNVDECENLTEMPDFAGTPNLEKIYFENCNSLCEVHPSIGVLKQLRELEIIGSGIKQVWRGLVVLNNLKELNVDECENLIEMPDFAGTPNLEKIFFGNCKSLCEVHPSIGVLKQLQELTIWRCPIKQVWKGLVVLNNLKELNVVECENLIEMPDFAGTPNLEIINFSNCESLCEVYPSIGELKQLQELEIIGSRIKQVWKGLVVLNNLKKLDLSFSEKLIETPNLTGAPNLEKLIVSDCRSLCEVHPSIGVLKLLKVLNLRNCGCLRRLPDKLCLESLQSLDLSGCSGLENFSDILGDKTFLSSLGFSEPTKKELPSSFMSFSGLYCLELKDCKNISAFPSFFCRFSSLESLTLNGCSRLANFPDLSSLKCLRDFKAHGTAISQLPSVNRIPESIRTFELEARKRMMARKSGDLAIFMNHERGSPVEYEMEGMLEVEALQFSFNRVDLSFPHHTIIQQEVMMEGWSLGYGIPDWVNNKSNGSSVKIELNGNMKGVESAFFIACDPHQSDSQGFSIYSLFEERRLARVTFKFCFETDEDSLEDYYKCDFYPTITDVCFVQPRCVFWTHTRSLQFLERLNLDKQSFIKISITAKITHFNSQTPTIMELEVKECGIYLVCPDEAGLGLRSDLDSFRQFYSAWECGMRRNEG